MCKGLLFTSRIFLKSKVLQSFFDAQNHRETWLSFEANGFKWEIFHLTLPSRWDTGFLSLGLALLQVSSLWATTGAHGGDPMRPQRAFNVTLQPLSTPHSTAAPHPAPRQPNLSPLHTNEKTFSTWSHCILDITRLQLKQFRRVSEITQALFKAPSLCHLCLKTPVENITRSKALSFLSYVFPSHLYYCCSLWYCKSQPRPTNQLSRVLAVTAGEGFHPQGSKSRIWSKIS